MSISGALMKSYKSKRLFLGIILTVSSITTILFNLNYLDSDIVAIKNVSVVTMEDDGVIQNQTVIISNGIIEEIDLDRNITIPKDAEVIDGTDKYLMPGLFDMHMHFVSDDRIDEKYIYDELLIPLRYGVLNQRVMIGKPIHLEVNSNLKKGDINGPELYVASPQLSGVRFSKVFNGRVVDTYEEGYKAVLEYERLGYKFI